MGVKSLWGILKPSAEKSIPSGVRLAVDTSIWMYQYRYLRPSDVVYLFSTRVVKLLHHGIRPVFVFDGRTPEIKRRAILQRRSSRNSVTMVDKRMRCEETPGAFPDALEPPAPGDSRYNWGDVFESEDRSESSEDEESPDEEVFSDDLGDNGLGDRISFDFVKSRDLSRTQKLQKLVELRGRRREIRTGRVAGGMDVFSAQQIKNLRTRNLISHNIKALEKKGRRKVHGDCRTTYELIKTPSSALTDKKDSVGVWAKEVGTRQENADREMSRILEDQVSIESIEDDGKAAHIPQNAGGYEGHLETYPALKRLAGKYKDPGETEEAGEAVLEGKGAEGEEVTSVSCSRERTMGGFFALDSGSGDESEEGGEDDSRKDLFRGSEVVENIGVGDGERIERVVLKVLEVLGVPYVEAPMEADAQCGLMCSSGAVDGVITEDNDVLLYGGTVYRNFFRRNREIEKYSLGRIESELGLSRRDLIMLSYLLGSDYTAGVKGVGPVKALEAVRKGPICEEEVSVLLELYLNPDGVDVVDFRDGRIDKDRARRFYEQSGVDRERIDEVMFFLERL